MHVIAAKAVSFKEALMPEFADYQKRILSNAKALSNELIKFGFELVSGGTDNHLMLVDLQNKGVTGKDAEKMLDEVRITVNKNAIPFDPLSPFVTSGIRLGTPAVTTRGMGEMEMKDVALAISMAIHDFEKNRREVIAIVDRLCGLYPLYENVD